MSAAFVVARAGPIATEDDLLSFCRARLALHQVPGSITFVEALPRNAVGKLIRKDLFDLATRESPARG